MAVDRLPRRALSLALRITLIVGAAMALLFALATLQIGRSIQSHFAEQDFGELQVVAKSLSAVLAEGNASDATQDLTRRLAGAVVGHHGVFFAVWDGSGRPIYSTAPDELVATARAQPAAERLDASRMQMWSADGLKYRGAVLKLQGHRALVAVATDFHQRYLARLQRGLWLGSLAASAVAVLAAWLATQWGLAPLHRIGRTIGAVGSGQLHVRLDARQVPRELEHLTASFNAMLDRLQDSFERLSDFSADIAHELRTPVTNLTTQTQVALSKPRSLDAYRELLYSSLEELDRMARMIGDMLFLAKADHRVSAPELSAVSVADEVRNLFDYFEALAEERGIELVLEGPAVSIRCDRLMLRRALSNLLSNGIRHSPQGEPLVVRLADQPDRVRIDVCNGGAGIAAEHLPRLFDRFYRVDPARQHTSEGAGLGLAIVRSIVEAHGGSVAATSRDGLTCFTIELPSRRSDAARVDAARIEA